MKIIDFYNGPFIKAERTQLYALSRHVTEIALDDADWSKNTKVELRDYIDENFDGERGFTVFSVWFENRPIMLCREAGRGHQDAVDQWITDLEGYRNFLTYVASLLPIAESYVGAATDPEEDIPALDEFYRCMTREYYDPTLKPRFKVGDVVVAKVMENHLRYQYVWNRVKWVWTRCKIGKVNPYNPTNTYWMMQMDRKWEDNASSRSMIVAVGEGAVGADGNDSTVMTMEEAMLKGLTLNKVFEDSEENVPT